MNKNHKSVSQSSDISLLYGGYAQKGVQNLIVHRLLRRQKDK